MTSLRSYWLPSLFAALALASFGACSSDEADGDLDDDASASSSSSSGRSGSSSGRLGSSSSGSSGASSSSGSSSGSISSSSGSTSSSSSGSSSGDAASECATGGEAALDAGSFCGAYDFRKPAAPFGPPEQNPAPWQGGTPAAGTYDAVSVAIGLSGGYVRETLVLDGLAQPGAGDAGVPGRYTRVRQFYSGSGGSPGPVSHRSGSYVLENATTIRFNDDCVFLDGVAGTPESLSAQYTVFTDECGLPALKYGATFVITLKQH